MTAPAAGAGIAAVLLDALGTLLELEPPARALVGELRDRFGMRVALADAERAIAAEISYYRAHLDEGRDEDSLATLRRRCAEVLGRRLPPGSADGRLDPDELTRALLASLRFHPYPDVVPALRQLRERRLRLVVVSNWDVSLAAVLARVGLIDELDAVITSAEVGRRKPGAEIFRRALEAAGVPAERALHVGDGIEEDIAGARAAGIRAVLIARPGSSTPPRPIPPGVCTITTLRQLAEHV